MHETESQNESSKYNITLAALHYHNENGGHVIPSVSEYTIMSNLHLSMILKAIITT